LSNRIDIDVFPRLVRELSTDDVKCLLKQAADDFIESVAEVDRGDILSEEESAALLDGLGKSRQVQCFENKRFRNAVFMMWQDVTREKEASERVEAAYWELTGLEQECFCSVTYDFEQLLFDKTRILEVIGAALDHISRTECGQALKIIRENAPFMPTTVVADMRALAWSRLSRLDPRFRMVFYRYRDLGGSKDRFLFSFDTPAPFRGQVDISLLRKMTDQFVKKTADAIHDFHEKGEESLIDENTASELLASVNPPRGMKYFRSKHFREFIYQFWLKTDGVIARGEDQSLKLTSSWKALSPEQQAIARELVDDFDQVAMCSQSRDVEIGLARMISQENCLGALNVTGENRHLDSREACRLRATAWDAIAKLSGDERFRRIAESYRRYSEYCAKLPGDAAFNQLLRSELGKR
jgi:hypothetical protein